MRKADATTPAISSDDIADLTDAVRVVARAVATIDMAAGCHAEVEGLITAVYDIGNQIAIALADLAQAIKRVRLHDVQK
jgi:hypothetical protein